MWYDILNCVTYVAYPLLTPVQCRVIMCNQNLEKNQVHKAHRLRLQRMRLFEMNRMIEGKCLILYQKV